MAENKQISMAATTIALRGVRLFLTASRAAVQRRAPPPPERPKKKPKPVVPVNKLAPKTLEMLLKVSKFNKNELEALYTMYRKLVTAAQAAATPTVIGQPPAKIDGIDQSTFRDVMHNTFELVTEETILERLWTSWDRGPGGGEGALKFDAWEHGVHVNRLYVRGSPRVDYTLYYVQQWVKKMPSVFAKVKGLSILLRGTDEERRKHCFAVYDLNSDGFITRDEMFLLLKNSLLKQPGDEDPDEGVRDLVELVLRKLDVDKDGKVSLEDYKTAVQQEPLLLEAFGQCLPTRRHASAFLKTLSTK